MKRTLNRLHRSWLALGLATSLGSGVLALPVRPAAAHEATCPYCRLDVVQDTAEQDNEVALRYGRKRIEYRCVFCALAQARTEFKGDVSILAPSEIKGKPVVISRKEGQWTVMPETAVFVGQKVNHQHCQTGYRAFSCRAGFDAHIKKHPELLRDARPLTLAQMVEIAK
jgi:hypothetical protein